MVVLEMDVFVFNVVSFSVKSPLNVCFTSSICIAKPIVASE